MSLIFPWAKVSKHRILSHVNTETFQPENYAYFMQTTRMPSECRPGRALSVSDIAVARVQPDDRFDVAHWRALEGTAPHDYTLDVDDGKLSSRGNGGNIY